MGFHAAGAARAPTDGFRRAADQKPDHFAFADHPAFFFGQPKDLRAKGIWHPDGKGGLSFHGLALFAFVSYTLSALKKYVNPRFFICF